MNSLGLNGSLWMGAQSLNTQRTAIETIGNNISNVNTPGYVRQRANIVTNDTFGIGGETTNGSKVQNIASLRDNMLDTLVQQSLGTQGYADNQANLTSTVQDALGEQFTSSASSSSSATTISGSGPVQDAMSSFFGSLQTLAATPEDATTRQLVVSNAQTLATSINGAYSRVQSTQSQIAAAASTTVSQINQLATTIATLNRQITSVESASGQEANDLRDSRAQAITQLSSLVNVTTTAGINGQVNVALSDNPAVVLVNGIDGGGAGTSQSLSVTYNASAATPLTVSASTTGALGAGIPEGGSLGSDLNVANVVIGSSNGETGLLGALDGVANSLRTQVNAQNAAGFDLNGNAGGAIFTGTGASDLAVSSTVASNPSLIAAGNGTGPLDGSNAQKMADLQNSTTITPAFQSMVAGLGQTTSAAADNQATQDAVTKALQTQQNSVEGVSIDEEMTNLIAFQQAYDASARFITTISSMYDTLVNHTGT